nr:histidine kinase [uncultured Undibacterium sp.]
MPEQTPMPPDQQVPFSLVGKMGSWSSKALHYPIFSPTWFSYRVRGFIIPLVLLSIFLMLISFVGPKEIMNMNAYLSFFFMWFSFVNSVLLGRWLAVKARSYGKLHSWSAKRETASIIVSLVIAATISAAAILISNNFGDKLSASKENDVTEIAKKSAPENFVKEAKKTDKNSSERGIHLSATSKTTQRIVNGSVWLLLTLWLVGVFDLRAYFRQRKALEEALMEEKIERYKRERNQAEMRLSVLASQVEPHFLFNTLSGVRAAMLSDPARGVAIIDHLVDYLRSTIPQMRSDGSSTQSSLGNQFDSVRAYLGVIHVRMPRLSFEVECSSDLLALPIPPLMLISLVENAVKHGIEPKKGAVKISVSAKKITVAGQEKLQLCVKDNGVGFGGSTSGSGIGLSNIRERLKQLYDDDAALSLSAGEDGGVEASIYLPMNIFGDDSKSN